MRCVLNISVVMLCLEDPVCDFIAAGGFVKVYIKNVDILCPHSEVLRKPMLKDKSCPRLRRHLQLVRFNKFMKFLRFQNVTEQIVNAMIYY